ncbi:MAG: CoA ester lyase [Pseudomonadota bacterium]
MTARSWLFVPGNDEHKMRKALDSGADAIILDLEDAVPPDQKSQARALTAEFLDVHRDGATPQAWVRINPFNSGLLRDDVEQIVQARPRGIVLPKPDSVEDVCALDQILGEYERTHGLPNGQIGLCALTSETARSVGKLGSFAEHPTRLQVMSWGAEDLSTDLGALANRYPNGNLLLTYQIVRSLFHLAASAAQLPAIDTVYPNFRDLEGLQAVALAASSEGFSGMLAIHPGQVPVINAAFTPDHQQIGRAQQIIEAFAQNPQAGAVQIEGTMLDRPHLIRAQQTVNRADKKD